MNRRFVLAAGGSTVGAALVLSGCSGTDSGSQAGGGVDLTAAQAVAATSQQTAKADTFKADLTVSDGADGDRIKAGGHFRLRPTLTFNATLDELRRGGRTVPAAKGRAIFTGDTLYAQLPQLGRFVSGGKPWVKVDVAKAGRQMGFDVRGLIDQVRQVNPAQQTKMFTASKDVRKVGTEDVNGVSTTHYTGTVTVQEALKQLSPGIRDQVRRWFPEDGPKEKVRFDLWTGKDRLPRKLVTRGTGNTKDGTVTVLYSDYGKSFSVQPPPADQVGELSLGAFLGGPKPRD